MQKISLTFESNNLITLKAKSEFVMSISDYEIPQN